MTQRLRLSPEWTIEDDIMDTNDDVWKDLDKRYTRAQDDIRVHREFCLDCHARRRCKTLEYLRTDLNAIREKLVLE